MPYDLTPPIAETSSGIGTPSQPVASSISSDLQQAWTAMEKFCLSINCAARHNRRLPKEILLTNMGSVMYRIVRMKCEPSSVDEAIRLGLLAFSSHIFLRVQDVPIPHTYFPNLYRDCLLGLPSGAIPPLSLVWLLMVGGISLFTAADDHWFLPWLRSCLDTLEANHWDELRDRMKRFLWIEVLHDKPGRAIFDTVCPGSGGNALGSKETG